MDFAFLNFPAKKLVPGVQPTTRRAERLTISQSITQQRASFAMSDVAVYMSLMSVGHQQKFSSVFLSLMSAKSLKLWKQSLPYWTQVGLRLLLKQKKITKLQLNLLKHTVLSNTVPNYRINKCVLLKLVFMLRESGTLQH